MSEIFALVKALTVLLVALVATGTYQTGPQVDDAGIQTPITSSPVSQPELPTPAPTPPAAVPTIAPSTVAPTPVAPVEASPQAVATAPPAGPTTLPQPVPTTPDLAPAPIAPGTPPQAAPAQSTPVEPAPQMSQQCIAEPGATQQDIDNEDSENGVWPHTPGQETTVYFSYGGMPERYAKSIQDGVGYWSLSPCIEAIAVEQCPENANCSTASVEVTSGDGSDGNHSGEDSGGVRTGSSIILYTDLLDEASDEGVLATAVHEMGHALGLVHRNDEASLMYGDTADKTSAMPDEMDFANLLALYGQEGDAAVVTG